MKLQLVGGPYDGTEFDHPTPLHPRLSLVVFENEDDLAFAETIINATGEMPSDDLAPTFHKCEYRLVVRKRDHSPVYLYVGETMHGEFSE